MNLDRIEKEILGHTVVIESGGAPDEPDADYHVSWRVEMSDRPYGVTIYNSEPCHIGDDSEASRKLVDVLFINATQCIEKIVAQTERK